MSFTTIEQAHRQAAEREEKRNPLASKMSLRDHFAAKAMQSILDQKDTHDGRECDNAAWMAYRMADAMLKARDA
jgi:hypothetical protein